MPFDWVCFLAVDLTFPRDFDIWFCGCNHFFSCSFFTSLSLAVSSIKWYLERHFTAIGACTSAPNAMLKWKKRQHNLSHFWAKKYANSTNQKRNSFQSLSKTIDFYINQWAIIFFRKGANRQNDFHVELCDLSDVCCVRMFDLWCECVRCACLLFKFEPQIKTIKTFKS